MSKLVTVIRFIYPHESGIPRSLLESEGIEQELPLYGLQQRFQEKQAMNNICHHLR